MRGMPPQLRTTSRLLKKTHMLRCAQSPRSNVLPKYASARRFFARLASEIFLSSLQREFFSTLLVNRDRVVTVRNRRHVAVDAVLFAPLDELPANFRIFILVFDQGAAFAQARRRSFAVVARACVMDGRWILAAAKTERDVSGRLRAGVKVGVEPAVGRAINTARLPIASDDLVAFAVLEGTNTQFFWPHVDIAL